MQTTLILLLASWVPLVPGAKFNYEELTYKLWGGHVLYPEAQTLDRMKCATKEGQYGVCRPLSTCRRAVPGKGRVPTVCGWNATLPYVCCPRRSLLLRARSKDLECPQRPTTIAPVPDYQDIEGPDPTDSSPEESSDDVVVVRAPPGPRAGRISFPGCGRRTDDDNEVLARLVEENTSSWPWTVEITTFLFGVWKRFLCSGALISRRYVLTAAYCFGKEGMEVEPLMFAVRLGSTRVDLGKLYRIEKVEIHESYVEGVMYHDLAVVRLREDVDPALSPVCLPVGPADPLGPDATLLGWGQKSREGAKVDGELLATALPILSADKCNVDYRNQEFYPRGIGPRFVCAGTSVEGSDSCTGDLGSPLVVRGRGDRWVLLGIQSGGFQCLMPGRPGVFTRVGSYLDWIAQHTDLS